MKYDERNKKYLELVNKTNPKTRNALTMFNAFWVGGMICVWGQFIKEMYMYFFSTLTPEKAGTLSLMTIIFVACLLTGIGVFDKIGAYAGAGTIIPITGFANSICSPAMEYKKEGFIFGLCVKMFTVAGPVIVNGIVGSIIVGLIYIWL